MPRIREMPLYRVWEELNQSEHDGADDVGALGVESAAQWKAQRFDREDPTMSWPRYFVVIDPAGKRWRVSVDRVVVYEYRSAKKENA